MTRKLPKQVVQLQKCSLAANLRTNLNCGRSRKGKTNINTVECIDAIRNAITYTSVKRTEFEIIAQDIRGTKIIKFGGTK